MVVANKVSGHKQVIKPETWDEWKKKPISGDPSRKVSDQFTIVDKEAMNIAPKNIPEELKKSAAPSSAEKSEE